MRHALGEFPESINVLVNFLDDEKEDAINASASSLLFICQTSCVRGCKETFLFLTQRAFFFFFFFFPFFFLVLAVSCVVFFEQQFFILLSSSLFIFVSSFSLSLSHFATCQYYSPYIKSMAAHHLLHITRGDDCWVVDLQVDNTHYTGQVWVKLHDPRVQANPDRLDHALQHGEVRKYPNHYTLMIDFMLTDPENNNTSDLDDDDDDIFFLNIYLSKVK